MKEYSKWKFHSKGEKQHTYMDLVKKATFAFSISFMIGVVVTLIYIIKDLFI